MTHVLHVRLQKRRKELVSMKVSALRAFAESSGIAETKLEEADDSKDVKESLVVSILEMEQKKIVEETSLKRHWVVTLQTLSSVMLSARNNLSVCWTDKDKST